MHLFGREGPTNFYCVACLTKALASPFIKLTRDEVSSFLASIPVAVHDVSAAPYSWLAIPIRYVILGRIYRGAAQDLSVGTYLASRSLAASSWYAGRSSPHRGSVSPRSRPATCLARLSA